MDNCFASFSDHSNGEAFVGISAKDDNNVGIRLGVGTDRKYIMYRNTSNALIFYNNAESKATFRIGGSNEGNYLIAQANSQVRLVLGSTGNATNNTSNWIRGTGNELGLNSGGGNIGMEIGGSAKMTVNTTGQILANPLGVTVPTFAFIGDTNTGMTRPTGDTLQFVTGGSARWRINSSGHLVPENQHTYDIGGTNAEVRNIYAQAISFASTANASGMTSELLDDYEEGTWTPTFVGATLAAAEGWYTKIGNQVTVHFYLVTTGGLPSSGTQVQVGALPYTVTSSFAGAGSLYVGPSNVSSATGGGGTIVTFVSGGEAFIRFVNVDTGVLGYTLMGELEVSSNNSITAIGTMTYQA